MAEQRIRPTKIPELIAAFGATGPGSAIQSGVEGFSKGVDIAGRIGEEKRKQQEFEIKKQELKRKISEELAKKKAISEAARLSQPLTPESPAATISGQSIPLEQVATTSAPMPNIPEGTVEASTGREIGPTSRLIEETGATLTSNLENARKSALKEELTKAFSPEIATQIFKEYYPEEKANLARKKTSAEIEKLKAETSFLKRKPTIPVAKPKTREEQIKIAHDIAISQAKERFPFGELASPEFQAEYVKAFNKALQDFGTTAPAPPPSQPKGERITATNRATGEQIESLDGGKTWQKIR